MPIKVLQLVEGFSFGGAETKLLELVKHMDKNRFETTVISLGLGNEIEELFHQLDCRVMTFQRQKQIDFKLLSRVRDFIRDEGIDIVMTTLFYADVLGAMAGHSGGARGVFSWETISSPKWLVPHRFWSYRYAIRYTDKVISVSKSTARWLVEKRKVSPHKVMIIPYGVNLDKFNPNVKNVRREDIGLHPDDIVIGQVSRLNEQKGHTYLIQAAPKILAQQPNVKFVLVGDGPLRVELEQHIRERDLQDNFVLLGFRHDVPDLLPLLDVFVLPSLYEGLPNVVLEAMACGLPVVATPVDGTKEAVIDGETGFLVPERDPDQLAQKLLEVISNDDLKLKLGLAGRRRVEDYFSLEGQVQRFEELYTQYALPN
ncbi:glycosyltransferase [candidate division KSB1 bacterium]|nr:glycosyltransferase [candidate division KSB1 bacterium]RQW06283.1 MAG: glycosyltransferase [candidate division KSB1 bacterium]